jgi:hypothetical protein
VSSNGGLLLGEVRATLATVLAPATVDDPPVLIDYPDSVTPPALVVVWDDPWLEQPAAMGPEIVGANLVVLCVGGRIDAGAGIDQVEQLVPYVIDKLRADVNPWTLTRMDHLERPLSRLPARIPGVRQRLKEARCPPMSFSTTPASGLARPRRWPP